MAFVLVLILAGAALYLVLAPRTYRAVAQVFVSTAGATDPSQLAQGNTFTSERVQSYTAVAKSPQVTDSVIAQLGLRESPSQLAAKITATAPPEKVLIDLSVDAPTAEQSVTLTNAVAQRFTQVVAGIEQTSTASSSPVKLTVILPATAPDSPADPNAGLVVPAAVIAALALAVLAAFLRELFENSFKSAEDLARRSEAPVLGVVPLDRHTRDSPVALRGDSRGARAEAFRQLRVNMQFVNVDEPPRIIAITSSLPAEGKTHAALNLAAAFAEAGQRVCLVEADLRRPTLAKLLGLVRDVGLTSVLIGSAEVEDVVQNAGQNLAVITSGVLPPNPSELLGSEHFKETIAVLSSLVDVVIIDTAPLIPVSDGSIVAAMADATVLVVRAGKTTYDNMKRSLDQMSRVGIRPVGTVLSMASVQRSSDYYYYSAAEKSDEPAPLKVPEGASSSSSD